MDFKIIETLNNMKLKESQTLNDIFSDEAFMGKLKEKQEYSTKIKTAMGKIKLNYTPPSFLKNLSDD